MADSTAHDGIARAGELLAAAGHMREAERPLATSWTPADDWDPEFAGQEPDDEYAAPVFAEIPVSAPPAAEGEEQKPPSTVKLRKASDIKMKGTRWVYRGRIPAGMVTLLAGREGIGKSTVALDIAARLTRGTLDGRYLKRPQTVVVCATEDSWEHTIRPRLQAVDADLERIFHISILDDEQGHERALVAPRDIREMHRAFKELKPALMIIDPLMAVIDGRVDTHKQAEVQQALEPMVKMCERVDLAIVALIHVNKSNGTDPLNNIMGSKAFATLPRSVLYCIRDDETDEFMMCHAKCNVGPTMPSVRYRISSVRFDLPADEVEEGDEPFITSSRIVWGDEDDRTATDVLIDAQRVDRPKGALRTEIAEWLKKRGAEATLSEIVAHFQTEKVSEPLIKVTLGRMVKGGEIERLTNGIYTAA